MTRKILSIVAGYAIFVASSLAFFSVAHVKPHAQASVKFMLLTGIYGVAFSLVSGFTTQFIARNNNLNSSYRLAMVIAGFAAFSYFKASGSHCTQLLAIFIFAPASVLGGWMRVKQKLG